ncbi:ribonuclease E/G [Jannaschia sp. Os4]|uniref:ribonuclease E/G n=1 Tax=Jannaschia sp. Os4 TaxID=2807617 RepID=UPI00193ACE1C|nr:ribonuclease E/G [Jannaschia sp. Os4]MBM2576929.1 ribonuclease E/G [Jannaschia sp. Os4]
MTAPTSQIVLGHHDGRPAAAKLVGGRLDDLLIDGADADLGPGAILRGVVDRAPKGLGGVFVRLPGTTGFLRGTRGRKPGETLTVQVTGWPEPGKAVPLTDRIAIRSRHVLVTPGAPGLNVARSIRDEEVRADLLATIHDAIPEPGDTGAILRTASAEADPADVMDDIELTWRTAQAIMQDDARDPTLLLAAPDAHEAAWRDWADVADVSEDWDRAADLLDALRSAEVQVRDATYHVEPTRALVAVDVNAPGGGASGLKANLACARDLMRQLRLRGLGGQVVIDCAPVPKGERRQIETAFKVAARACPVDTNVIGWTPLGHLELTRKRERRPISEVL